MDEATQHIVPSNPRADAQPPELRTLDAINLATALSLGGQGRRVSKPHLQIAKRFPTCRCAHAPSFFRFR